MTWARHLPTVVLGALALWCPALLQLLAGNLDLPTAALRFAGAFTALALGVEAVGRLVERYRDAVARVPQRRAEDRVVDGTLATVGPGAEPE